MASYLTPAQFREHVVTRLPDTAVQRLLDANSLAIDERNGPIGSLERVVTRSNQRYIWLDRPAATITSITEFYNDPVGISGVILDSTDWRLLVSGTQLERWGYGTHPGDWWSDRVDLIYMPVDDTAERIRVLLKLCQLDINRNPGSSETRIGSYIEQQRGEPYDDEREAILASLAPSPLTFA